MLLLIKFVLGCVQVACCMCTLTKRCNWLQQLASSSGVGRVLKTPIDAPAARILDLVALLSVVWDQALQLPVLVRQRFIGGLSSISHTVEPRLTSPARATGSSQCGTLFSWSAGRRILI